MIRTLLIASLAALAAAEAEPKADADPYLVYGGYHPYYALPVVKAAEAEVKDAEAVEEKKTVVPLHYPISYGYPIHHYYGKREAEPAADADAKADPWLAYSGYTGYPYTYGHLPYYTHPLVTKKVVTVKAADGEEETKKVVPLTLPLPTDTTATAMDSTGHTDSAGTTVDTSEDTGPTDIPTGDKEIAARFLSYGYRADTTQMCSES